MTSARGRIRPPERAPRRALERAVASALALTLATLVPGNAPAIDLEYDLGLELRHSDNINLSATNPQDDNMVEPTLRFELSQAGAAVQVSGQGQVQYTDYLEDTFDDEVRGGFAGGIDWSILPERLNLVFQDYLSQQNIDDLDPSTPDNLQHVNLFVMGPSLHTRFNPATRGQFDLRYGNTWAEELETFNGDRFSAAARVKRELNPTTEIGGNLEAAKIEYDPVGSDANYKRYDAYLSYKLRRVALDLDLDAGYSQLDRAASAGNSNSPLVRAAAAYKLTPRSVLRADVRRQYTDATQYLITPVLDFSDRRFSELAYRDITIDPNVFRERSVRVGYEFNGIRTSARVQPYVRRIDYFNAMAEDQDLKGVAFDVEYRPRPLLSLSLYANQEKRDYDDLARDDKDTLIDVGVTKRFTRHWSAGFHVTRRERESAVPGQDYRENSAQLSFNYRR